MSIIELLVATVLCLTIMGATVTLFGVVGDRVTMGRNMIELNHRLSATELRLRQDLRGLTVESIPWTRPEAASGYLEIIKGLTRDTIPTLPSTAPNGTPTPAYSNPAYAVGGATPNPNEILDRDPMDPTGKTKRFLLGYTQDVLMLTTRSKDIPFRGLHGGTSLPPVESQTAEVAWFMYPTLNASGLPVDPPTYTLYRRELLVRPDLPPITDASSVADFNDRYDISAHLSNGIYIPNSLADLSYRENRYAHNPTTYPYVVNAPLFNDPTATNPKKNIPVPNPTAPTLQPFWPPPNYSGPGGLGTPDPRNGDDAVLTNVLSFDIKVWDPQAILHRDVNDLTPIVPSDPGWTNSPSFASSALNSDIFGAYVDLNYGGVTNQQSQFFFAGPSLGFGILSGLDATKQGGFATYDTWSTGYKLGYYPGAVGLPNAVNGFDNNNANGVGDPSELIVSNTLAPVPPYPVALRGVQIKIRVYEPSSRQVREVTIVENFVPD